MQWLAPRVPKYQIRTYTTFCAKFYVYCIHSVPKFNATPSFDTILGGGGGGWKIRGRDLE